MYKSISLILLIIYNLTVSAQINTYKHINDANIIATEWLSDVNSGNYEVAYNLLTNKTKNQFEKETWIQLMKELMNEFGELNSREIIDINFKDKVEGLEDGFYVFIDYECNYKKTKEHTESIILKQNDKTKWEILDYFNWFKEEELSNK